MSQSVEINESLKEILKSSIREVLAEERLNLIQVIIPTVSKKEMTDIEKRYKSPDKYKDETFTDKTEWFLK